jgi:hypothetical protein
MAGNRPVDDALEDSEKTDKVSKSEQESFLGKGIK